MTRPEQKRREARIAVACLEVLGEEIVSWRHHESPDLLVELRNHGRVGIELTEAVARRGPVARLRRLRPGPELILRAMRKKSALLDQYRARIGDGIPIWLIVHTRVRCQVDGAVAASAFDRTIVFDPESGDILADA